MDFVQLFSGRTLNFKPKDYPWYKANCHVAKCDDYSHLSWILLWRVPKVISDGNSHLTGRWIFFASFWLGPTLFRSYTSPGIARVTTEDLDDMRSVFLILPTELSSFCLRIMTANKFKIGAEMDFFRFFLARTEIISVLNLTRNTPSHHRIFRWDDIFFCPLKCLEPWSFCYA